MSHNEYRKILPDAQCAIVFIHGILGTPRHFQDLLPLVPEGWSVVNLLLDGHGRTVRDFSHTSMKKWKLQVADEIAQLSRTHEKIYIAAHSMGTLLAIQEALRQPEKIAGLFLLACPLALRLRWKLVANVAKVYLNRISPKDAHALATRDACSIQLDKRLWLYLGWIPRYLELFFQIGNIRKGLSHLKVKTLLIQSAKDEMVSPNAHRYFDGNPNVTIHLLEKSAHFWYDKEEYVCILRTFQHFLES